MNPSEIIPIVIFGAPIVLWVGWSLYWVLTGESHKHGYGATSPYSTAFKDAKDAIAREHARTVKKEEKGAE